MAVGTKEKSQGHIFMVFTDATYIFAHNKELADSSDLHKMMAKAGVTSGI